MKQKIKLTINAIFVSVNQQYGTARMGRRSIPKVYLTLDSKMYKENVIWTAKMGYKGKPIESPIKMSIWYYFKDKRRRDIQNDKLTFDSLADGGIYKDDSQIHELNLYKRFDKKNPRTEIIIEEL